MRTILMTLQDNAASLSNGSSIEEVMMDRYMMIAPVFSWYATSASRLMQSSDRDSLAMIIPMRFNPYE